MFSFVGDADWMMALLGWLLLDPVHRHSVLYRHCALGGAADWESWPAARPRPGRALPVFPLGPGDAGPIHPEPGGAQLLAHAAGCAARGARRRAGADLAGDADRVSQPRWGPALALGLLLGSALPPPTTISAALPTRRKSTISTMRTSWMPCHGSRPRLGKVRSILAPAVRHATVIATRGDAVRSLNVDDTMVLPPPGEGAVFAFPGRTGRLCRRRG